MKKMLALLLSLMMLTCSFAALAETAEVDMSDWMTVSLTDLGMEFYRPGDMTSSELTDEDYENGIAYAATGETLSLVIVLYAQEEEDMSGVEAELAASEGYQYARKDLNGLDVVIFETTTEAGQTVDGVVFAGADGYMYQFMFYLTDAASQELASTIMNTLHAVEE